MSSIRRINCENCSAPYAINVATLRKEKNTVTCRRCKHKMIVYKSGFSEPENEKARVVQEDEKTLVDEEPKVQQDMPTLETEISTQPPPLSMKQLSRDEATAEENPQFDQTAKPEDFVPLHSRKGLNETLRTEQSPRAISPRDSKEVTSSRSRGKVEDKFTKASPSKSKTASSADASMAMIAVAFMIFLAMLSAFAQYMTDGVLQKVSLISSVSSLMLAFFLVLTSSFGRKASSLGISIGLSGLSTVALGAGLFFVGGNAPQEAPVVPSNPTPVAEKKDVEKPVEEAEKPEEELVDAEKKEEEEEPAVVKSASSAPKQEASVQSSRPSPKSEPRVARAEPANPRITAPEPSEELPPREEVQTISDPIDDELMLDEEPDEDLDLGGMDMDLDLDAEEEKKGLFAKKKEEPKKPEPIISASNNSSKKVDIPQSVMDIIIRNNKDVRACYMSHRAEYGQLPKSVEVLFTLQPSGKVSQAYIAEGPHVGSKFESCLRSAFKKMTFPAFDSSASPQSLRYTLKI